jgi:hypothetical protein
LYEWPRDPGTPCRDGDALAWPSIDRQAASIRPPASSGVERGHLERVQAHQAHRWAGGIQGGVDRRPRWA